MNLLELAKKYETAILTGPEDGPLNQDALDEIAGEIAVKLDALGWLTKERLPSEIQDYKNLIDRCRAKIAALENRIRGIKDYAGRIVSLMPDGKHKGKYSIYQRHDRSVEVDSVSDLPECFRRTEIKVSPDKDAIKTAILSGQHVPGARLVESSSWCVR